MAFIEWKLLNILEGRWNFRMESTKDGKKNLNAFIKEFIIRTSRPQSKLVSYNRVTKLLTVLSKEGEKADEGPARGDEVPGDELDDPTQGF